MKTQIVGTDSEATSPTAEEAMADLDGSSKRDIIGVAKRDQAEKNDSDVPPTTSYLEDHMPVSR